MNELIKHYLQIKEDLKSLAQSNNKFSPNPKFIKAKIHAKAALQNLKTQEDKMYEQAKELKIANEKFHEAFQILKDLAPTYVEEKDLLKMLSQSYNYH